MTLSVTYAAPQVFTQGKAIHDLEGRTVTVNVRLPPPAVVDTYRVGGVVELATLGGLTITTDSGNTTGCITWETVERLVVAV